MGEDQAVVVRIVGDVQKSANVRFDGVVGERLRVWAGQATILNATSHEEIAAMLG